MMTTTEEKLFSYFERQIELLEEILEILKQQSSKVQASRQEPKQTQKVDFTTAKNIVRSIMATLKATPDKRVDIAVFKQLFKGREAELQNALEYLQRQGRIKIQDNWIQLVSEKTTKAANSSKKWEERKRKIKEAFSR